ncbi:DUF397 domain-containing protein [Streptomyces coeruleoprunus]|uniref:DUF397 domain-containing protein n=1 Tax=Streptomyces coeruleoprunus TaxID=285563 RepID=A0ABV9XJ11_9ACTN
MSAYLAHDDNLDAPVLDGLHWRRSSRSVGMNNCVEAARLDTRLLAVRDSKDTGRPPLRFSPTAWSAFVSALRDGPDVAAG